MVECERELEKERAATCAAAFSFWPEEFGLGALRLAWIWSIAGLGVLGNGGAGSNGLGRFRAIARQIGHERSDLEGHLLAFGDCSSRLALDQVQFVVPRIDLDAASEGQSSDLLWILFGIHGSGGFQVAHAGHTVAKVSADEIWNFLLAAIERLEEKSGVGQLIFVRRLFPKHFPSVLRRTPSWQ